MIIDLETQLEVAKKLIADLLIEKETLKVLHDEKIKELKYRIESLQDIAFPKPVEKLEKTLNNELPSRV